MEASAAWQKLTALGFKPERVKKKNTFKVKVNNIFLWFSEDENCNEKNFVKVATKRIRYNKDNLIVVANILGGKIVPWHWIDIDHDINNQSDWVKNSFIRYKGKIYDIPNDPIVVQFLECGDYLPLVDYLSDRIG